MWFIRIVCQAQTYHDHDTSTNSRWLFFREKIFIYLLLSSSEWEVKCRSVIFAHDSILFWSKIVEESMDEPAIFGLLFWRHEIIRTAEFDHRQILRLFYSINWNCKGYFCIWFRKKKNRKIIHCLQYAFLVISSKSSTQYFSIDIVWK